MSYILDALKKSETERQQGRVPDLGQQIRMIHRNKRRGIPAVAWLTLALVVNAAVLLVLFWPGDSATLAGSEPLQQNTEAGPHSEAGVGAVDSEPVPTSAASLQPQVTGAADPAEASGAALAAEPELITPGSSAVVSPQGAADDAYGAAGSDSDLGAPLIIRPSPRPPEQDVFSGGADIPEPFTGRVPHLVEMPMAFQRQVPDLVFNSHVYASNPADRRVMINNRLLRTGETMGGLRVERITEEGVELSMDGQRFRVGVVRDWSAPR